ncbi:MAG: hypothetical protein HOC23_17940 [Halieaceae bacterium]|jgi:hypothetical protein|nr:hypothetical protein [Halieaceae bacterium]
MVTVTWRCEECLMLQKLPFDMTSGAEPDLEALKAQWKQGATDVTCMCGGNCEPIKIVVAN